MSRLARLLAWACLLPLAATRASAAEQFPLPDAPFAQDYREPFVASSQPAENDIRAMHVDAGGRLWLATAAGFRWLDDSAFRAPAGAPEGPAFDLALDADGAVVGASWNGLFRLTADGAARLPGFAAEAPVARLAAAPGKLAACTPEGLWIRRGDDWRRSPAPVATSARDMLWVGDDLWMATALGVYIVTGDEARRLWLPEHILTADAFALAADERRVYVGSDLGIDVYEDGRRVDTLDAADGLPSIHVRKLAFDRAGTIGIGTTQGLVRRRGDGFALRHSLRWLPADDVRDLLFDAHGAVTVATAAGLAMLKTRTMTLAEKADHFERLTRARHVRTPGLVEVCRLRTPGDLSSWEPADTDNDGMYTGQYLAAQSYRYAVTRDPAAKAAASAAFAALEFLQTVTGTEGFIARTVVPIEWTTMADANRTYTPVEAAVEQVDDPKRKIVEQRWRPSDDGRWLWKGDTSSDEISGHYFSWGVFYDLAADDAERERLRRLARRVTDHIIEGHYSLRDIDGRPTQWAVWDPEILNKNPNWAAERNTNSLEIMALLHTAAHITGDDTYRRHADELLTKHGYDKNLLPPQSIDLGLFTHIDSQLLGMDFRSLLTYAPAERRATYRPSLDAWFQLNRRVGSPFYNFTYGDLTGEPCDAAVGVAYLRQVPLDMVRWSIDNSRRADVRVVHAPQSHAVQVDRLLPPDERPYGKWDSNPFQASDGDGGRAEGAPTFWLLPYWLARHHNLIAAPEPAN